MHPINPPYTITPRYCITSWILSMYSFQKPEKHRTFSSYAMFQTGTSIVGLTVMSEFQCRSN